MQINYLDATREHIRDYINETLNTAVAKQKMTPDLLANKSGVTLRRVVDILFNKHNPTVDEAAMLYMALGIPLSEPVAYIVGMTPEDAASFKATGEIAA